MKVAKGLLRPTTALGRWLKRKNKTLSDLVRGASISQPTASAYVEGRRTGRADHHVMARISEYTNGEVTIAQLGGGS